MRGRSWARSGWALLALASVLVGSLIGCDSPPNPASGAKPKSAVTKPGVVELTADELARTGIEVHPVLPTEFRTFRDFPGIVKPDEHALAEITALVRGRVVEVYADLGQDVQAGTPLALLDSSELGLAQSADLKAEARFQVADQASRRAEFLLAEKVIGQAEAQRRLAEAVIMGAEAKETKDRLKLLGMTQGEIRRLERTHDIRSSVTIAAPFSGRVIVRNLTKGEVVETSHKLFAIADLSEVWVEANVPEKDIPFIAPIRAGSAQTIEVRVNAYPDEVFPGTITYVGDVLDPATRTLRLRLELPNPHGRLKPEMFATIRISSQVESSVLAVPEEAVQHDRGRTFVFVQREPGVFEPRDIKLGESNGALLKVLQGLQAGDRVVIQGAFLLKAELLKHQAS